MRVSAFLLLAFVATPALAADPPAAGSPAAPAAAAAPATASTLKVDGPRSLVVAIVYKQGAASAVAHDHAIQAKTVSGTGTYSATDASKCTIDMTVKVSDLVPDEPAIREKMGMYANGPSESQRAEILEHILADYQLYADKYNTIRFRSTSFSGTTGDVTVKGDLTLRGVTHSISVPMNLQIADDGSMRAKGKYRIKQSDYGYSPYSALFGALAVQDGVDVVLDVQLVPGS